MNGQNQALFLLIFLLLAGGGTVTALLWAIVHDGRKLTVSAKRVWQDYERSRAQDPGRTEGA